MIRLGLGKRKGSCFRLIIRALARERQPQGQGFVWLGIPVINMGKQPMTIAAQYQGRAQPCGARETFAQESHRYLQSHDPLSSIRFSGNDRLDSSSQANACSRSSSGSAILAASNESSASPSTVRCTSTAALNASRSMPA